MSIGIVRNFAGNINGTLLNSAQGWVNTTHFQVSFRHVVRDFLGREQEHLFGDMVAARCDDTQSYARKDICVVALSWFEDFSVIVDFTERRARREYTPALLIQTNGALRKNENFARAKSCFRNKMQAVTKLGELSFK